MAKLSLRLDLRKTNKQGEYPIKFYLTHGTHKSVFMYTGVSIEKKYWNGEPTRAVTSACPNARAINKGIAEVFFRMQNQIIELTNDRSIEKYDIADLRDVLLQKKKVVQCQSFSSFAKEYVDKIKTNTKNLYEWTLKRLDEFTGGRTIFFEDITFQFLEEFDEFMADDDNKINTRSIHLRNIRAIINKAIDYDVCPQDLYPFRKFKIKTARKEKEFLDPVLMKKMIELEIPEKSNLLRIARDLFLLSFYMCGANPIDLYTMKKPNRHGVVEFVRTKIKYCEPEPIKITLQPEAMEIIDRYRHEELLLNISDHYLNYNTFYRNIKKRVDVLGEMIGEPNLTMYWARYSWATYASKIGVEESVIGKALGHTDNSLVAQRYISFDWTRVDAANRRVIDYVVSKIIPR